MNLESLVSQVHLGDPITFGGLTMVPLVGRGQTSEPYLTLDEALASGAARVSEVSEAGSVPELRVENTGGADVLLVDGEELVGAKQNRVLNLSILVAATSRIVVPVSCVEAGRWQRRSAAFSTAGRAQFAEGRAKRVARVSETLRAAGSRRGDQSEVWADISDKAARMRAHSATSAMSDIYDQHRHTVEEYVARVTPVDGQVGAIFGIGDVARGLELFDCEATFRRMLAKLVRSYAIDAAEHDARRRAPNAERHASDVQRPKRAEGFSTPDALAFLERVRKADATSYKAVGKGTDVRLHAAGLAGAALMLNDRVVHLAAFAVAP